MMSTTTIKIFYTYHRHRRRSTARVRTCKDIRCSVRSHHVWGGGGFEPASPGTYDVGLAGGCIVARVCVYRVYIGCI